VCTGEQWLQPSLCLGYCVLEATLWQRLCLWSAAKLYAGRGSSDWSISDAHLYVVVAENARINGRGLPGKWKVRKLEKDGVGLAAGQVRVEGS